MDATRAIAGIVTGALIAAGIVVAPAFGAIEQTARPAKARVAAVRSLGSFTPAAADPRLAAIFARGGFDASSFRFTPSETRRNNRAVTVAVRTRSTRTTDTGGIAVVPTVGLAPIAYNLGVAVGWKRFAVSSDVTHIDLAGLPGSREALDVGVSYAGNKFTGQVKAGTDRPLPGAPKLVEAPESYSLDVGGAYSLTRNLDLTAGVRYRSERERIARLDDNRRDSQAVYVGTAFRF